jgi:large subunit ribosomal protein L29
MATVDELRQKTLSELRDEAAQVREELAALRWDLSLGRLKDVSKIKRTKKRLAQILTIIRQKEVLKED